MKLSEAIRLGSLIRPQGFESFNSNGKSCALGAAMEATNSRNCKTPWPWLSKPTSILSCPMCGPGIDELSCGFLIITHLNDNHKWTREAIADWIETVEPKEEAHAKITCTDKETTKNEETATV